MVSELFLIKIRLNKRPASNKNHEGRAKRVWDMTSGGVRSIPRIKQLTITYGLFLAKLSGEVIPVQISKKIKTGISKAMAKAKKMERIKSR